MVFIGCQCGHFFKVPATQAGKSGNCPACRRSIRLIATQLDPEANEPAVCLTCTAGPRHVGRQFFLAGSGAITVGKSSDRDLSLADPKVSRLHCQIHRSAQGWRIIDQGSTNGIEINGHTVPQSDLHHGDEVVIGDCVFTFLTPLAPAPSPANRPPPTPTSSVPQTAPPSSSPGPAEPPATPRVIEVKRKPKVVVVRKTPNPADPDKTAGPGDDPLAAFDDTNLLALAKDERNVPTTQPPAAAPNKRVPAPHPVSRPGIQSPTVPPLGATCPSCNQRLPLGAVICVNCGINLKTGKSILTSLDTGLDETYARAESITRWLSWIIVWGIYPVASEAFGTCKPYAIRGIAIITVLVSLCFLVVVYSGSSSFDSWQNLMLWSGKFDLTDVPDEELPKDIRRDLIRPADVGIGSYHPYQLVTHAFLHAGLLHLAGNMLFLMVFGSRVNALIGNVLTVLVYPLLAIFAALFQMAASTNQMYHPSLGASGAVMGLAGMYFMFFPIHKMHILTWYRFGILLRFELKLKIFTLKGFWVVLFYVGLDVLYTVLGADDNVAHWAHMGGFITGMVVATGLMMTRLVNARGSDLFTSMFGRHAWDIVGRPNRGEALAVAAKETPDTK